MIDYKGVQLECDKESGLVLDRSKVPFEMEAVVRFTGAGESPDWKDLKVSGTFLRLTT